MKAARTERRKIVFVRDTDKRNTETNRQGWGRGRDKGKHKDKERLIEEHRKTDRQWSTEVH